MKWNRTRTAKTDQTHGTSQHQGEDQQPGPARTGVNSIGTRAAVISFYGLIAAIGVVAAMGLTYSFAAEDHQPVVAEEEDTTSAESLAQNYVASWLSSSRDDQRLVESIAGSKLSVAPEKPLEFEHLTVADVTTPDDSALVSVTVSAIITETAPPQDQSGSAAPNSDGDEESTDVLRYYQVAVTQQEGSLAVVGYPTPISGPPQAETITLAYPETVNNGTALEQAVTGFLESYATGGGDVSRYTAPGTELEAITPAPYQEIKVTQIRTDQDSETAPVEGQQARVLVDAEAVLPSSSSSRLAVTWSLTLQARSDRWEITAIDPVPLTSNPDQPTAQN